MILVVATMARQSHFGNIASSTRLSLLGGTARSRAKRSVADSLLVSHIRMSHELLHILRVTNYDKSDELQTKYPCATRSSQGGKTRVHFFFKLCGLGIWTRINLRMTTTLMACLWVCRLNRLCTDTFGWNRVSYTSAITSSYHNISVATSGFWVCANLVDLAFNRLFGLWQRRRRIAFVVARCYCIDLDWCLRVSRYC